MPFPVENTFTHPNHDPDISVTQQPIMVPIWCASEPRNFAPNQTWLAFEHCSQFAVSDDMRYRKGRRHDR